MELDASFWALIGLILFLGLLAYLKVPGTITGALDKRAKDIEQELSEAKRLREEAQTLLADFERRAEEAEKEAEAIVTEAKAEAERMTAESEKQLAEMLERRAKAAEDRITQAEAAAIAEVRSRAGDLAIAAATQLVADKAKGDAGARLMDDGIKAVKAQLKH